IRALGLEEDTLLVFDADHGETLYDHDCFFDHHSIYDPTLHIPLFFHLPGKVPAQRFSDICQMKDITPTILDILGMKTKIKFDGRSLQPLMQGKKRVPEPEMYLTECTWMRKHGWRTPEWKLIHALEPDFHFKPEVELYNLITDPEENQNLAKKETKVVQMLEERMQAHIAKREKQTGRTNPMYTNLNWHGHGCGPFKTSQQAYDTMHIGSPKTAEKIQAQMRELRTQRGAKKL
ncbi:MAG TPA: sulfatase-like hydrolase/transferase, partial [bacterium]|nr:sulfatase-like hydrolase/transferase [bacterium]